MEDVLLQILDGLRNDPLGPKLDWKSFFTNVVDSEAIVVWNGTKRLTSFQKMMLLLPVKDHPAADSKLKDMWSPEPKLHVEHVGEAILYHGELPDGMALTDKYLLIGDLDMIRQALGRKKNRIVIEAELMNVLRAWGRHGRENRLPTLGSPCLCGSFFYLCCYAPSLPGRTWSRENAPSRAWLP